VNCKLTRNRPYSFFRRRPCSRRGGSHREGAEGLSRRLEVVAFTVDGKEVAENNAKKLTFINKADGTWIVESEGKEISSGKSDIDPTKKPKTIDFMPTRGALSGNEYVGIYELGKDTRQICFIEKAKADPRSFLPLLVAAAF
jgi:uncharacterized protein (TIGR03067 family)